jgi:hypothetical protein
MNKSMKSLPKGAFTRPMAERLSSDGYFGLALANFMTWHFPSRHIVHPRRRLGPREYVSLMHLSRNRRSSTTPERHYEGGP